SHVYQRVADAGGPMGNMGVMPPQPPGMIDRPFPLQKGQAPAARSPQAPRGPVPVDSLEFMGRLHGKGKVKFLLTYSSERQPSRLERFVPLPPRSPRPTQWVEMPLTLDFDKAEKVTLSTEAKERRKDMGAKADKSSNTSHWPVRDDLEGLWAAAQIDEFGRLQNEVSEFGFYSFAIQATARKYLVPFRPGVGFIRGQMAFPNQRHSVLNKELYETT